MYHKTKPVTKATTPSIAISLFIYYSVLFKSYKFLYRTRRTHEQASRKGQFTLTKVTSTERLLLTVTPGAGNMRA